MLGDASEPIRSQLTFDDIDGLRITIPAKTKPPAAILLQIPLAAVILLGSCWLASATCAFLWSRNLAALKPPGWLLVVTGVAYFCVVPWVVRWGKSRCYEIVRFDGDVLALSRHGHLFLDGGECPYRLSKVRNLRYAPYDSVGGNSDTSSRPSLAFDFEGQTIHFGLGLSEEESRRLIRTIKDRYKILEDKDEPLPVERL